MRARESIVNKQMRLLLEQQTAAAFMDLVHGPLLGLPFSLLGYDFGPEGNVAYKTTLSRPEFVRLLRGLLNRWAGGATQLGAVGSREEVIDAELLRSVGDRLRDGLPAGVGFSLLIGSRLCTAYISSAERSGVIELLAKLATSLEREGN